MKGSELDMKYSQEEILKALHVIKETCESYNKENEEFCPFFNDSDGCLVSFSSPDNWRLNEENVTVWKGLL